jgi:hypothetical protein
MFDLWKNIFWLFFSNSKAVLWKLLMINRFTHVLIIIMIGDYLKFNIRKNAELSLYLSNLDDLSKLTNIFYLHE